MNAANKREESLTLEILEKIEKNDNLTQRHLANSLGVALGLANSYMKRCVRKGLIKVHQAPANRFLYYLTPKGFAEKSRLTANYLSSSFDFYRCASQSLTTIFNQCEENGYNRILFCGVSELAEIATIRTQEHNLKIIGIFDPNSIKTEFLYLPVLNEMSAPDQFDACVITALNDAQFIYDFLKTKIKKKIIFTPSILGVNTGLKK